MDEQNQLARLSDVQGNSLLARVLRELPAEDLAALRQKAAEGMLKQDLANDDRIKKMQLSAAEMELFVRNLRQVQESANQDVLTRFTATRDFEGATGTTRIEVKRGLCFVATAVYGSAEHTNVRLLRRFRDECLEQSPAGRFFSNWYYRNGEVLALSFLARGVFRLILRIGLNTISALLHVFFQRKGP